MNTGNGIFIGAAELLIAVKTPTMLTGHINRTQSAAEFFDYPHIHAIVLKTKVESIILVSLDLLELDFQDAGSMRYEIAKMFGVSLKSVTIACTHTHTAPPSISLGLLAKDSDFLKNLSHDVLCCVKTAMEDIEPCLLKSGKSLRYAGINRRLIVNGKACMMPNPDGLRDDELIGLWFIDKKGFPKAAIINYSMHPTTLDVGISKISGDYPEYIRQAVQRVYPLCKVVFFNGACGDVRPDLRHEDGGFRGGNLEDVKRIGDELGEAALETLVEGKEMLDVTCMSVEREILLEYDYSRNHALHNNLDIDPKISRQIDPALMKKLCIQWEESLKKLSYAGKLPESARFLITVVALNSMTASVFLSGEVFVETGLAIKRESPFPMTIIGGYANGTVGYIPTTSALALGGYEAEEAFKVYGNPAPFMAGSEEFIVKESLSLLHAVNDELLTSSGDYS